MDHSINGDLKFFRSMLKGLLQLAPEFFEVSPFAPCGWRLHIPRPFGIRKELECEVGYSQEYTRFAEAQSTAGKMSSLLSVHGGGRRICVPPSEFLDRRAF